MKRIVIPFLLAAILVIGLNVNRIATTTAQTANTLSAVRVEEGSMDPFDALWVGAPSLSVSLVPIATDPETPGVTEVALSAAFNDTDLWILAAWTDDTMNVGRNSWTWDGSTWVNNGGNEDRLGLMFGIAPPAEFETAGCFAACHTASEPNYMGFPEGSTNTTDLWYWKASRTAPASYADDQWVTVADLSAEEVTGRQNDEKESGGYSDNRNEPGDGPAFTYSPEALYGGALTPDSAVAVEGQELFWGQTVPGYVVSRPVGSRGDVEAASFYVRDVAGGGRWFVVLHRALNTGNPDDATLAPGNDYPFGVAVFNNTGGNHHMVSAAILTLALTE